MSGEDRTGPRGRNPEDRDPDLLLGPDAPGVWCGLRSRSEEGGELPVLAWQAGSGWRMVSSGVVGGGIGPRDWWANAQVPLAYDRRDPGRHLGQIAGGLGLTGAGVGMVTAADVTRWQLGLEDGVRVLVTVGLGVPIRAAASAERIVRETVMRVGTINVLAVLPVPLSDAALVNAVVTVTEAKTQALLDAGIPGTGTASDSVCVACPEPGTVRGAEPEPFCGPRSTWGVRLARATHGAVLAGAEDWLGRHGTGV